MTMAKLEMQAAVFGVRLRELILEEHDIEVDQNTLDRFNDGPTMASRKQQQTTGLCGKPRC